LAHDIKKASEALSRSVTLSVPGHSRQEAGFWSALLFKGPRRGYARNYPARPPHPQPYSRSSGRNLQPGQDKGAHGAQGRTPSCV